MKGVLLLAVLSLQTALICKVPVVIIHKGNPDYLTYCLKQAVRVNNEVYFIGDANPCVAGATFHDITNFHGADHFKQLYFRYTNNCESGFQRFCMERWYILRDFMLQHNVPVCFYCDTDVLLFCDVDKIYQQNFKNYDLALLDVPDTKGVSGVNGRQSAGALSYWSYSAIEKFCVFMDQFFMNEITLKKWRKIEQEKYGVFCDMTLSSIFVHEYNKQHQLFKIANLRVPKNNSFFELNHSFDEENQVTMTTKMGLRLKEVRWTHEGFPLCFYKSQQQWIDLNAMHFVGGLKKVMQYFQGKLHVST